MCDRKIHIMINFYYFLIINLLIFNNRPPGHHFKGGGGTFIASQEYIPIVSKQDLNFYQSYSLPCHHCLVSERAIFNFYVPLKLNRLTVFIWEIRSNGSNIFVLKLIVFKFKLRRSLSFLLFENLNGFLSKPCFWNSRTQFPKK